MINLDEEKYIEIDDRIDAFLKGMMSEEDEQSFKKDVSQDAELRQRVKEKLLLLKGIRAYGHEQDEEIVREIRCPGQEDSNINKEKTFHLSMRMALIAIAACLLAIFVIPQFFGTDDGAMDYAMSQYTNVLGNMDRSLRGSDAKATQDELKPIFNAVLEDRDIKDDISKLEALYTKATDEYVDDVDDYAREIGWVLAVAYMKDGNNAKAAGTLRTLLGKYPDFTEAGELLKKLE